MFYEFGIPLSASFNSSGGQSTCPSLLRRSSVFPCAFYENKHFGQEPAVTALIFYCPYPLRRCGRPERPVPSHHFLSPPTFCSKDLRTSRGSSGGSVCAEHPLLIFLAPPQ